MREDDWLIVEFYDEEKIELYDLSSDMGQHQDVAKHYPDRVVSMRERLNEWRKENDVQYNVPNPDCDEKVFRELYIEMDPSKFDPLTAPEEEWNRIQKWRKGMDGAVQT
jgi:hypothetical protein